MKNIYLYGASDDCMKVETDYGVRAESYVGIMLGNIRVHYEYDGDWTIWLEGNVPLSWIVRAIAGNSDVHARFGKEHAGQFLHIQVPNMKPPEIIELDADG